MVQRVHEVVAEVGTNFGDVGVSDSATDVMVTPPMFQRSTLPPHC